jgi:transposase
MSRKSKYIKLTESELKTLEEAIKYHPKHEFRQKSQALLFSHQGLSAQELSRLFGVRKHSILEWYRAWEAQGIWGLLRRKGQGRKPYLSISNSKQVKVLDQAVAHYYQDSGMIRQELMTQLGLEVSRDTVKRFLKKMITDGTESVYPPKKNKTL